MHLDIGEQAEDGRHVAQLRPVELQVLARGEMAVAAVIALADQGELSELPRIQRAIGHGDPQHIGVELEIDAVLEPERLELVLGQRAVEPARDLVGELGHPLPDETLVEFVITIHEISPSARRRCLHRPACRDRDDCWGRAS